MSTRSVITRTPGKPGRYVHHDGYPTGVGASLFRIVKRDGIRKARRVLTAEHFGWSSVDDTTTADFHNDPERFVLVPGYGVAYSAAEHLDEWAEPVDSEEWGYTLGSEGLVVLNPLRRTSTTVPWTCSLAEADQILRSFESHKR